jgi:hypothetical protein
MTTSAELRAELCDLYAERSRREKRMLEIVRAGNLTGLNPEYLNSVDFGIADLERQISEAEAATPVDQRIAEAELLVSEALDYSEGVRLRHATALDEVAEADADLERAVEAAKQVIAKVAEEQPELRGKVGETGCFQIARGMKYETVKVGEGTPTVTVKFVKAAFNPERS